MAQRPFTPQRTEKNTPGMHIMGRVPSSLTPTCDCMKVVITLAKSSLDICLFIKKIFSPIIILIPDEKYDFEKKSSINFSSIKIWLRDDWKTLKQRYSPKKAENGTGPSICVVV